MAHILKSAWTRIQRVIRNQSGSALVYTAAAAPVLLGIGGLSVDVAYWHVEKRSVQAIADSAAIAGSLETLRKNGTVTKAVELDAVKNGYDSASGDTLQINTPPTSGPYTGSSDSVEIIASKPLPLFLAKMFLPDAGTVTARAVATAGLNDTCVWALNPTAKSALKISGGADVTLSCGAIVNSTSTEALTQSGTTSCFRATSIKVVGNYTGDCVEASPLLTNVKPATDPLATLAPPPVGPCDTTSSVSVASGDSLTLNPGVYCGNIKISASATVKFRPGLYILNNAGLSIGAQANVTGTGVTFYLSENSSSSQNVSISAGATVNLVAQTSGDYAGVLFFSDRNAPNNVTHQLTGGASMNLEGIAYFPNQNVAYSGGTSYSATAAILVAQTINFTGGTNLGNFEGTAVEANTTLIQARLVE